MNKEIFSVYTAAAGKFCVESDKKPAKKGFSSVYLADGGEAVIFWELYPENGGTGFVFYIYAECPFGIYARYLYTPTEWERRQVYNQLKEFFTPHVWYYLLDIMQVEQA